eukprot:scaffold51088_cov60-Phaeocystis_antarctica.AAC.5
MELFRPPRLSSPPHPQCRPALTDRPEGQPPTRLRSPSAAAASSSGRVSARRARGTHRHPSHSVPSPLSSSAT